MAVQSKPMVSASDRSFRWRQWRVSHTRYLAMRHMTISDGVWQRMVLTAIHWGYKPSIPDQSQSKCLVLFICMMVCTMTNACRGHPMTKDPLRVTRLPAEGERSNWRRRWGWTCPIRKEIPDTDKDRAARREPYLGLASSAAIVPGQRDKGRIYIYFEFLCTYLTRLPFRHCSCSTTICTVCSNKFRVVPVQKHVYMRTYMLPFDQKSKRQSP